MTDEENPTTEPTPSPVAEPSPEPVPFPSPDEFREAEIVWKTEKFIGLNFLVRIDPKNAEVALLFRPINS